MDQMRSRPDWWIISGQRMQLSASEFCWMVRSRASVCSFKMVCSVFSGAPVSMWSGSQGFRMECQNVFKVFRNGLAKLCVGGGLPGPVCRLYIIAAGARSEVFVWLLARCPFMSSSADPENGIESAKMHLATISIYSFWEKCQGLRHFAWEGCETELGSGVKWARFLVQGRTNRGNTSVESANIFLQYDPKQTMTFTSLTSPTRWGHIAKLVDKMFNWDLWIFKNI